MPLPGHDECSGNSKLSIVVMTKVSKDSCEFPMPKLYNTDFFFHFELSFCWMSWHSEVSFCRFKEPKYFFIFKNSRTFWLYQSKGCLPQRCAANSQELISICYCYIDIFTTNLDTLSWTKCFHPLKIGNKILDVKTWTIWVALIASCVVVRCEGTELCNSLLRLWKCKNHLFCLFMTQLTDPASKTLKSASIKLGHF